MTYEQKLAELVAELPQAVRDSILETDKQADEIAHEARARAILWYKDRAPEPRGDMSGIPDPPSVLANEGRKEAAELIFNEIAGAYWERADNRARFLKDLKRIQLVLEEKPPLEGYADVWLRRAESAWNIRALKHWEERPNVTSREIRLREFLKRNCRKQADVAHTAKVPESEVSRWAKTRPGERKFIPNSSKTARKIESVLRGDNPLW